MDVLLNWRWIESFDSISGFLQLSVYQPKYYKVMKIQV